MDCQKASEPAATGAAEAAGEAGAASSRSADATWCLCPSFVTPSALSRACNACVEKQGGSHHASARMAPSRRYQRQRGARAARRLHIRVSLGTSLVLRPAVAKSASRAARWLALLGVFSASRGQSAWPHRACSRHGTVCPRVVGGVELQQRVELGGEAVAHRLRQAERRQLRCEAAPSSPRCHAGLVRLHKHPPRRVVLAASSKTELKRSALSRWTRRTRCAERI